MSETQDDATGMLTKQSRSSYFQWEIPNFCTVCKNIEDFIYSPVFTNPSSKFAPWKLKLYPKGNKEECQDWLSLYLVYGGEEKITVNVKLSLLDNNCKTVEEKDMEETYFGPKILDELIQPSWGYVRFVKREYVMDKKNKLLKDGKLKILCEMTFKPEYVVSMLASANNQNHNKCQVSSYRLQAFDDLEKLFENELHSDVTIVIGKNKLQAHKAILASRSQVFDAMFKHDMKEKEENTIEITDVSYEVMKEVLRFVYASKVNDIQSISSDLLVAAEKYSIEGLKALCEETLHKKLNLKNAIEYLKLSDMCNAAKLKPQVIEFIVCNQKAITEKPEFDSFGDLHSKLQCELVRALAAKNSA